MKYKFACSLKLQSKDVLFLFCDTVLEDSLAIGCIVEWVQKLILLKWYLCEWEIMYIEISITPSWLAQTTFSLSIILKVAKYVMPMVIFNDSISLLNFYQINHVFRIHCCFRCGVFALSFGFTITRTFLFDMKVNLQMLIFLSSVHFQGFMWIFLGTTNSPDLANCKIAVS